MAREIHDTIAHGLIGIVTQLEAAEQAHDRPADRDRHLDNARPAGPREPRPRRAARSRRRGPPHSRPEPCPRRWPRSPRELVDAQRHPRRRDGDRRRDALHPEIEVALLRTAQEALANVARHSGATRAGADAVLHGRRRDARRPRRRRRVLDCRSGRAPATARASASRRCASASAGWRARSPSSRSPVAAPRSRRGVPAIAGRLVRRHRLDEPDPPAHRRRPPRRPRRTSRHVRGRSGARGRRRGVRRRRGPGALVERSSPTSS